ncbi:aminotransferase class I/II-fold pyridoxal phosphate-dependent enzyme [Weissella soli]|uniref:Aminotransferase n=2 Tax=Weissella soli TaxID=155866 RepID=A0A288Q9D0_9LACO|nr:aminotransferase class I/II-fold pyridoxal phosphate-dependent enzyme [Weissella soli]AOT56490.1 Putative N-acetyl-LL-diaminopimelate aminotransferase [Weissella soli]NKY82941.1 aminotransferase class I/II-fold pyridoxal phosphate-dependent enzyme [Weissella soli]RDL12058.1 aromatic amino acid aminotransferase [Weissella soli]GEN92712.1 aminotransferase [Weissella soli]
MPATLSALSETYNHRLAAILPSPIRVIDSEFAQIPGILRLTLGEPDFAVPAHIKEAVKRAVDADDSHYATAWGHVSLREAIADYLATQFDAKYDPQSEILVTVGASEAIYATFNGLLNPGDKIIIPTPTFPMYEAIAEAMGVEVIGINTAPEFVLTPAKLEAAIAEHPDVKAVMFNYPSNPTGVTYSDAEVHAIADVLKQHELLVFSDEIYAELIYDAPHTSIASILPEQTILISGLSKSHAMTGYRIGYIAGPADLMKHVGKMHQFLVTTAPGPMMAAAEEALRNGHQDAVDMRNEYKARRDMLVAGLTELGFTAAQPGGAFYLFVKIPAWLDQDDMAFIHDVANTVKLGIVAGSIFGAGGEGYVRLSYAASMEDLQEALVRLGQYVALKKTAQ